MIPALVEVVKNIKNVAEHWRKNNCMNKGLLKSGFFILTYSYLTFDEKGELSEINFDGYYIISKERVSNVIEEDGVTKAIELK